MNRYRHIHSQPKGSEQNSFTPLIRSALLSGASQTDQPIEDLFRELFSKEGAIQKSVTDSIKVSHQYLLIISFISSDSGGKIYLVDFDNKRELIEGKKELVSSDLEVTSP